MQQQLGSGKTAVLVERIINKIINENIDIDKLLIVTFTNAAAAEMRERILDVLYKKIDENPNDIRIQKQITLLNKANISTIHSFCLDVIKNNFYEIGISPNFRIGDTSEIEILKQETLEEIFEELYEQNNSEFINLVNIYGGYKDDEDLKKLIMQIYSYSLNSPFPNEWIHENIEKFNLNGKLEQDFSNTVWGKILIENFIDEIKEQINILELLKIKLKEDNDLNKYFVTILEDINILQNLVDNSYSFDKIYNNIQNIKFKNLPSIKNIEDEIKEKIKDIRNNVKKKVAEYTKKVFVCNSKEANEDIFEMYAILRSIENIIIKFEEKYQKNKSEKNIIDFSDIEHFALNILLRKNDKNEYVPTNVAKKYKEQFKEIAIDEYQDSNLVQEYILNSISNNNNIFMVGDVKQSIYKFRGGRPDLFLEKYNSYVNTEDGKIECKNNTKIQLFKNFRSRESILNITNFVFSNIMSKELGDIDYTNQEYLNLGMEYEKPEEKINYGGIAELHIIDLKQEQDEEDNDQEEILESEEIEANFVANKINSIISHGYYVYDKKLGYRKATYKDFVILLRSTMNFATIYEKALINAQIPVFSDVSQSYFESEEIETIIALLKIIDNPNSDIPLVTILRSPIFEFTDNELLQIRLQVKEGSFYDSICKFENSENIEINNKIQNFFIKLKEWQEKQEFMTLDEFIWYLYQSTGYYDFVNSMPDGNIKTANLKLLFEKAKDYELASFKGLYNFINYIERVKKSSRGYNFCKGNWRK